MSFERPAKGVLVIQCDACYDTKEFLRTDGDPVNDYRACWRICLEEGWSSSKTSTDQFCEDCARIAKSDSANPLNR